MVIINLEERDFTASVARGGGGAGVGGGAPPSLPGSCGQENPANPESQHAPQAGGAQPTTARER